MVDIRKVDLNLLKVLDLLFEELSVTRVAARLGCAQPTISADLKKLREVFDDPLFVRHPRGLKPTPRMEAIGPQLRSMIRGIETIIEPPDFNPKTAEKTFRIVAGDYSEWLIVPRLCAMIAAEAPGVRIAVMHSVMGRAQKLLETGDLDLAISVPRLTPPWLQQRLLVEDRYCVVARKGHPRLGGDKITLDQFCGELHAVTVRDDNIFELTTTDRTLAELGRKRQQTFITRNYSSALKVIEQTDLIGMGLEGILPLYPTLQAFPPPFSIVPMRLIANWNERSQADPAHAWLRRKLAEVTRDMRPA